MGLALRRAALHLPPRHPERDPSCFPDRLAGVPVGFTDGAAAG